MEKKKISPHFNNTEFACKCGCGFGMNDGDVSPLLLQRLEQIREFYCGAPVTISSGCRCPAHNKAVGGASHSQHVLGTAADIKVGNIHPSEVFNLVNSKYKTGGTGRYKTFTHVDVRPAKATWVVG